MNGIDYVKLSKEGIHNLQKFQTLFSKPLKIMNADDVNKTDARAVLKYFSQPFLCNTNVFFLRF